ncbi:transposase [Streptomyces sp. HUAS ZL42]|uniref:IS110 family transposase n=1 Tax=Streptomyces sp. HUAS ZL42 TaxID=3231715 RepID=UPI00345E3B4C
MWLPTASSSSALPLKTFTVPLPFLSRLHWSFPRSVDPGALGAAAAVAPRGRLGKRGRPRPATTRPPIGYVDPIAAVGQCRRGRLRDRYTTSCGCDRAEIWAGSDIERTHHHCLRITEEGARLLSGRVRNDETELLTLIGDVLDTSRDVLWALDPHHGDFF